MPTIPPSRHWLEQARADLRAAQSRDDVVSECHRRYWLQQAYEKTLKSYLIAQLHGEEREILLIVRDTILGSHAPLTDFPNDGEVEELEAQLQGAYPNHWRRGLRLVKTLRRHAHAFVARRSRHEALYKLDDTRPSIAATVPSYRYPFFDDGEAVAPGSWRGWDRYQGRERAVVEAVAELVNDAGPAIALSRR